MWKNITTYSQSLAQIRSKNERFLLFLLVCFPSTMASAEPELKGPDSNSTPTQIAPYPQEHYASQPPSQQQFDPSPLPFAPQPPFNAQQQPPFSPPSAILPAESSTLKGGVQENSSVPTTPPSYGSRMNGSYPQFHSEASRQDPFANQNQVVQPLYNSLTPLAAPGPNGPDLRGLLQSFMSLQKRQMPQSAPMPPVVRPKWLPGYAFTNDSMIAPYHNMDIASWDKNKIPQQKKWIKLSGSVTRYWQGPIADPCMVLLQPLRSAPGNFSFSSAVHGGPHGWLQDTGASNSMGFPLYRYWFDGSVPSPF